MDKFCACNYSTLDLYSFAFGVGYFQTHSFCCFKFYFLLYFLIGKCQYRKTSLIEEVGSILHDLPELWY